MSKRTNPHKKALKQHAAAMHNARYMLGKEFDALEAGRKQMADIGQTGEMGIATSNVASGTLAEFMENCAPGDVYVERGIEVVKDQPADGQLQVEDVVEFLNDIGAYPVSSSSDGVQIDPSKPIEISFSGSHEPRDYQLPVIAAAAKALEGDHIPRMDFGEPLFVIDSISDMKGDIKGTATVVSAETPSSSSRFKEILLGRSLVDAPHPVIDPNYGGMIGFAPPEQPKE